MAFKLKIKEKELMPDCIDFKPFLFNKRHCKLSSKCNNAGGEYKVDCYVASPDLCNGINQIRYDEWLKKKYKL